MNNVYNIGISRLDKKKVKDSVYTIKSVNDGSGNLRVPEDYGMIKHNHSVSVLDTQVPNDKISLVNTYREIAKSSDVDEALKEIVNETFSGDGTEECFRPKFKTDTKISKSTQDKIQESFDYIYHTLLDFDKNGYRIFRQYYVDGEIIQHMAVDKKEKTIKYLQPIDVLQCRRFRVEYYNRDTGLIDTNKTKYYYYYLPKSHSSAEKLEILWNTSDFSNNFYRFNDESIAYADSGLIDQNKNMVLSHLYKTIRPYNNLQMMEEAMMIYRIVRAPERRAIYIDVGSMGTTKAMQYVNDIKNTFNNKTVFDSSTNSFVNKKSVHSMVEDYYLPRRDGQKGTEISSIGGAENLGVTKDIDYLKDKFYRSLNVPIGRLNAEMQQSMLLLGRVSEMQRDEYRFKRFIDDIRKAFIPFIEKILKTELILRNITTEEEWINTITKDIYWDYKEDNSFIEIKKNEKIRTKLELLSACENYVGVYFSKKWVMREILNMTDAEIDDMEKEIKDNGDDKEDDSVGGRGW